MSEIKDTGKVWIRGKSRPTFAVCVDDKFFVPGKEEEHKIDCWVEEGVLCVDLQRKGKRIARRFGLSLCPVTPASLFSGFEKTKHRDVSVVLFSDAGVEEYVCERPGIEDVDREAFWRSAIFIAVD